MAQDTSQEISCCNTAFHLPRNGSYVCEIIWTYMTKLLRYCVNIWRINANYLSVVIVPVLEIQQPASAQRCASLFLASSPCRKFPEQDSETIAESMSHDCKFVPRAVLWMSEGVIASFRMGDLRIVKAIEEDPHGRGVQQNQERLCGIFTYAHSSKDRILKSR